MDCNVRGKHTPVTIVTRYNVYSDTASQGMLQAKNEYSTMYNAFKWEVTEGNMHKMSKIHALWCL